MKLPDRKITIFYLLYFGWLFTITFLSADETVLDYYAIGVILLYFAFMREPWDAIVFGLFSIIPLYMNRETIQFTALWIPIAWGTTAIAMKKFFVLVTR
jgi:hypothetical protein